MLSRSAGWKDAQEAVELKVYQAMVPNTLLYACETWELAWRLSPFRGFPIQFLRRCQYIKDGACINCSDNGQRKVGHSA